MTATRKQLKVIDHRQLRQDKTSVALQPSQRNGTEETLETGKQF